MAEIDSDSRALAGHRVLFATATEWDTRLHTAHAAGKLESDLARLRRYGLIIVDEVGYIPFEQDAANLFFQLVPSRYEHALLILTRNLPFARWGNVFSDQVVAAALIDRIAHYAEVSTPKGISYRLKTPASTHCPPPEPKTRLNDQHRNGPTLKEQNRPNFRRALTPNTRGITSVRRAHAR